MLTTIDNPYNPITDYHKWLAWDHDNGYHTQEYLARVADVDSDMDDQEVELRLEQAVQSILDNDILGVYKLV